MTVPIEQDGSSADHLEPPAVAPCWQAGDAGWMVYMIQASDSSLYTGITNNLPKRWQAHISGKGAKYFHARKPQQLLYLEVGHDRRSASRREYAIKQLSRRQKQRLLNDYQAAIKAC